MKKPSVRMTISAISLLIILDVCSISVCSTVLLNSSYTTTAFNTCACAGVVSSEQCLLNETFASLDFFREGTTKYVCQNVLATVRPVHESPTLQTMSQFEQFNTKCLTQTSESTSDYLSIYGSSQCSSFCKCCVMCSGCPRDRIINDEGPTIVKSRMYVHDLKTSQFILLIKCATTSPRPIAGYQFFEIRLSNRDCTLTPPTSTSTPMMSKRSATPYLGIQTTETETSSVMASTATNYKILMTTDNRDRNTYSASISDIATSTTVPGVTSSTNNIGPVTDHNSFVKTLFIGVIILTVVYVVHSVVIAAQA